MKFIVDPEYVLPYAPHEVRTTAHSHPKSEERVMYWHSDTLMREVVYGDRKMILHPLSRLIEEIEHGGEKFFPVNYWEEHLDRVKIEDELVRPVSVSEKYNYIAIEGNIGAGKTSLAKMISDEFNAKKVLERFTDNPFLPKFYKNQERYAFPLEMSFLADRYQQLSDDLAQFDLFKNFIISDYYIFKSLIFAQATLQKEEYVLYRKMFNFMYKEIAKPDLYVYLYQDKNRLLDNIKKRGRAYEQNIQPEYLQKIHRRFKRVFCSNTIDILLSQSSILISSSSTRLPKSTPTEAMLIIETSAKSHL